MRKANPNPHAEAFRKALNAINLPKHILTYLVGERHPLWLRLTLGALIMFVIAPLIHGNQLLESGHDLVHAVGAVPWLDFMVTSCHEL